MDCSLGEIRIFAGDFVPVDWLPCDGQLLEISAAPDLFDLIGTTYGGDGAQHFALPDLRGRVVVGHGQGPGLSDYREGDKGGHETVQLSPANAGHHHPVLAAQVDGTSGDPAGNVVTQERQNFAAPGSFVAMNPAAIGSAGRGLAHENRQPYLAINYIIAIRGMKP